MTELANRLKAKPLPREVRVAAEKELRRLKRFVPPSLPSFFPSFHLPPVLLAFLLPTPPSLSPFRRRFAPLPSLLPHVLKNVTLCPPPSGCSPPSLNTASSARISNGFWIFLGF